MGNCMASAKSDVVEVKPTSSAAAPVTTGEKTSPPEQPELTPNEKVADQWFGCFTSKEALQRVYNYSSEDCLVVFSVGDFEMPLDQFITDCDVCYDSFPDLTLSYRSIKEVSPGKVVLEKVLASGTHTGAPYAFGPYPPIPAANVKVVDPPAEDTFFIENGKVVKYVSKSSGDISGPPNFYIQIGGLLI